jgi:hypothetical protein
MIDLLLANGNQNSAASACDSPSSHLLISPSGDKIPKKIPN